MKELSEIIQEMVDNGNSMGQMDLKTAIVFVTEAYESGMEKARSLITNEHNEEDYWYFVDPYFGTYTEEEMISSLDSKRTFYKEGVVYQKPHIILEFSEKCADTIYFDSDEEMEGWFESFMEEFGKPFIYID